MGSTGSNNLIGLNWDNSTIGVGNESSISVGITVNSDGVDDTTGSSVSNLGSIDSWLINRDNSSVSVGNKTMWVSSGIRVGSIRISSIANGEDMSKLSKVNSSGKSNLGCLCWDHSTVGVSHQSGGRDSQTGRKNLKNKVFLKFIRIRKLKFGKNTIEIVQYKAFELISRS